MSKEDDTIDTSLIVGKWMEFYDPLVLAMDTSLLYEFKEDGTYHLHTYDWLEGNMNDKDYKYSVVDDEIAVWYGDIETVYTITLLTKDEMAWQKKGTSYSENRWGSDYMHFVRY